MTSASNVATSIVAVEILGTGQTVDASSYTFTGAITAGLNIQGTSITTTLNGDFVMQGAIDFSGNGGTYTAGTGTVLVQSAGTNGLDVAIQGQVQATAGAINPTMTSSQTSSFGIGVMAFTAAATPPPPPPQFTSSISSVGLQVVRWV